MDNQIFLTKLNCSKNKSPNNYYDISNIVISKEIFVTKDRQFIYSQSTCSKTKYLSNNAVNNNRNVDNKLGNINLWLDNFKVSQQLN